MDTQKNLKAPSVYWNNVTVLEARRKAKDKFGIDLLGGKNDNKNE